MPGKSIIPASVARCGAKTRKGTPCEQFAGARTNHPRHGRCWLHGGTKDGDRRLKHGRDSSVPRPAIYQLQQEHLANPDPLNVLPELAMLRAHHQQLVDTGVSTPEAAVAAQKLLDAISKMVERIERVRAANAISRADLNRLIQEMARVVDTVLPIDGIHNAYRQQIVDGWRALRV